MADDRNANVVLTADVSNYSQQMTAAQSSTNAAADSVMKLLDALDRLSKNAGRKLELISVTTVAGITAATVAAGRLESQMSTLQATAAITGRSINTANAAVDNLRRSLPVSTEAVVGLVTALGKMGTSNQNVEKLAATFIKLGAATGEDINGLAQGMIGLQRAMGTTEESTVKFANSVAGLSANLGVSATGILQFSQSLAPVARTVGMTQTEVMGLSAAFLKSGQDGYAAANATVKMITDISRATRYGSADLSMYANLVGKTTEEFAKMGSTDQLQALFNAINKSGPDSIKILERMGLDGPRALKAIQGLAQSGSLQSSLSEATRAFNGDDLEKGSKAAMDGFNDSLTRLRNNLTSIGQEFGKTFLPLLTAITESFEGLTRGIREALGPINAIVGALAAAGAAGTGIAGFAVSNMGMLGAAAAGLMLMRSSLGAGMAARRWQNTGEAPRSGIYQRSIPSLMAGQGSWFQQRMFTAGSRMENMRAGAAGAMGGIFGNRAAGQGNLFARAAMLGSMGVQGLLRFAQGSVDPLTARQRENIVNRSQNPFRGMGDQWNAVRTGQGASFTRAITGATGAFATFGRALVGATAGITQMGLAAARTAVVSSAGAAASGLVGAGRRAAAGGLAGLGRIGGGLLSAVGGPAGAALIGGLAVGGAVMQARGASEAFRERLDSNTGSESAVNKYASSLGLAGSAAMSFANTLKQAESQIEVSTETRARAITRRDVNAALTPGRELTNSDLAGMSEQRAGAYAGSILGSKNVDPNIIQAFKLDLIQEFDQDTAQRILNQRGSQNFRPGLLVGNATEGDRGFFRAFSAPIKASEEFKDSIQDATDAIKVQSAEIYSRYGEEESTRLRNVAVNQMLSRFGTTQTFAAQSELGAGIEQVVGGNLQLNARDLARLGGANNNAQRMRIFRQLIGSSSAGQDWNAATGGAGQYATTYTPPSGAELLTPNERGIRATMAGGLARNDPLISRAIAQPADANLNLQAARQWADQLVNMTGSTTEAAAELQRLREASNDAGSDISLMADSALQALQRTQQRELAFASSAVRGGVLASNVATAYDVGGPDQQQRIIAAEDAVTQEEIAQGDRYRSVIRAFREFDISVQRQTADFNKQRARQDYEFSLSRRRSQEDYALSRARSDQDYYTQLERGQYNYDLQRRQSQDDFDKSRRRAEADYQHQIVMMARQTAQSITDIYQRITTQPTWDANNLLGNAQDQLSRMQQQQADLRTVRGMGVSGDVIEMMGLNDFQNQQQLARFVSDLATDPSLVEAFNKNIAGRLDMGKAFTMDQDSDAWKEMQRAFALTAERTAEDYELMVRRSHEAHQRSLELMAADYTKTVSRGADDYAKMLERQSADYQRSVSQTVTDWSTQMERARTDLNRSFEEISGSFESLQEQALGRLSGAAAEQMNDMATKLAEARARIKTEADLARTDITNSLAPLFGSPAAAQAALNAAVMINGGRQNRPGVTAIWGGGGGSFAEGGQIPGYSPHPKADNIPAMLTAGEFVQPVSATEYYGVDVMKAIQSKKVPKWAVQGFADGGLVEFGRLLQSKGFRVGEHPLFGGVNPVHMKNSLHYRGQAIDVNYGPGGTSLIEQKAIDAIVGLAKNYGLSTIWRAPGHFNHAHFDTGNYSKVGSSTALGNNPISTPVTIDVGAIMKNRHVKNIENTLSNMPSGQTYSPSRFTVALGTMLSRLTKMEPDPASWYGQGSIFSGAQTIGVGEHGAEAVLPLNMRGADFLAETMNRLNPAGLDKIRGGQVVETRTITYRQHFDQSTDILGPITVVSQDPNEMARKLEEKARMDKLRGKR